MTYVSLADVRLADGSEPPTGAAAGLLTTFDIFSGRMTMKMGRRTLMGVLSHHLSKVASDAGLDGALEPLLKRGFLEAHDAFQPTYDEPPFPGTKPSRIGVEGEPDDGEPYYTPTTSGVRAARFCAGLKRLGHQTPWLLGQDRIEDQILVAFTLRATTRAEVSLWCCTSNEADLERGMKRLIDGGLLERASEGGQPSPTNEEETFRLTHGGHLGAAEVAQELIGIAQRLVRGASPAVPSIAPGAPALVRAEARTPDLSWMRDASFRSTATGDFAEIDICLNYGAHKAALLLAGSACEAMLLDMLERNTVVAKTYISRNDFPDRASLEQLVEAAVAEKLLTSTGAHVAPAIKNYRDLIHAHRVRTSDIKVHSDTARLWVQAAVVMGRELAEAATDGRAVAFEQKS